MGELFPSPPFSSAPRAHSALLFLLSISCPPSAGAKGRSVIVEGVNKLFPVLFKFRKGTGAAGAAGGGGGGGGGNYA
jgi:hypothetical protein